jgi:hypothetical protein
MTLAGAAMIAAALLAAARLRLFRLPDIDALGFVGALMGLAHVVAILNHVGSAEFDFVVGNLCHNKLLVSSSAPFGDIQKHQDRLSAMPTRAKED